MPTRKVAKKMPQNNTPNTTSSLTEQESQDALRDKIIEALDDMPRVGVPYPPCSDVMLSLINKALDDPDDVDITVAFDDYFRFLRSPDPIDRTVLGNQLVKNLFDCANPWPPQWSLPPSCVTLMGSRDGLTVGNGEGIKRLFIADLVWLFYFERMGVFKILGVILDDFTTKGKIPISNGSVGGASGARDQITALILEAMVRQTKMGMSSAVRERDSSYRRCLGWTSDVGRKLGLDTAISTGFNNLFHKFIQSALEYYKDKRLAVAIQASVNAPKPSVATLITIGDTMSLLKKTFETFDYGRNFYHALSGIVWVIAGMSIVKQLRTTLGIPQVYNRADEYIPAAYDILVMKTTPSPSQTNRYTTHQECARSGRDLLLDIQMLNTNDPDFARPGKDLETWLNMVENKVEGYRTAYRTLTGVDLGAAGTPTIEQQA